MPNYVDTLSNGFPNVIFQCAGDPTVYESLVHIGGDLIPPKFELDAAVKPILQKQLWVAIQAERDRRTAGGVKVGSNWYHSDQPSRIQQLGLVLFGANMPTGIMWKTMSGAFVEMTPTLAVSIFQSIAVSDQTIFAIAEQKRSAMLALEDPGTYSIMTGWPVIYGEA